MSRSLTARQTAELLRVYVGPPTSLDDADARKGRGRPGFTHVELRANLTKEQRELLGRKRMSRSAFLPKGKRKYDAELKALTDDFAQEVSDLIMRAAADRGIELRGGTQTFGMRARAMIAARKGIITSRSYYNLKYCWFYSAPLHDIPLDEVTVDDVERCVAAARRSPRISTSTNVISRGAGLEGEDESISCLELYLQVMGSDGEVIDKESLAFNLRRFISAVFTDAAERGILVGNPAKAKAVREGNPKPPASIDPFSCDEARVVRSAILSSPSDWTRVAFLLQMMTGIRPEEALGLQFRDLDLDGEEPAIFVRRAVSADGLKECKTSSSRRSIGIDEETVEVLKE